MVFPGTPVRDLFPLRRPIRPPGFGPRLVMSPAHNLLLALRVSFAFVDQRINVQREAEEASAQRFMFETNLALEAKGRGFCIANCKRFTLPRFVVQFKPIKSSSTGNSKKEPLFRLVSELQS